MFSDPNNTRPLLIPQPLYVPNEVVVTVEPGAASPDVPHFLSVASGVAAATDQVGEGEIDRVLRQVGVEVESITRVFVPREDVVAAATAAKGMTVSLTANPISANYTDREKTAGMSGRMKITFTGPVPIEQVCERLEAAGAVVEARPNFIHYAQATTPNDPLFFLQWGLPAISAPDAWDLEQGHPDVVIAIVDSGVHLNHPDLQPKLLPGHDFVDYNGQFSPQQVQPLPGDFRFLDNDPDDEDGHGTHCAGIAAGGGDNGTGIAGVCWGGKILPVRVMFRANVFDPQRGWVQTSIGLTSDIEAGIGFAIGSGAHVISLSLGGPGRAYESVMQLAASVGVTVVAATGNGFTAAPSWPAADPNVLAVGAIDENFVRAQFSNYNPSSYGRFVMAPGVNIVSSDIAAQGEFTYKQGTSMATPFVAGLAGLVISAGLRLGRRFSPTEVYEIIRSTTTPLGLGRGDFFHGEGLVNARRAVEAAIAQAGGAFSAVAGAAAAATTGKPKAKPRRKKE